MNKSVERLLHGVIISCQAYEDTPLYGPENMKIMAECAILGKANGIRACWKQDIEAIRSITDLPIIGINKVLVDDSGKKNNVFITPTYESAISIIEAGADIVAMDCSFEFRSYEEVMIEINKIKKNYPNIALMADISTLEEGIKMAESGMIDIISTTLSGRRFKNDKSVLGPGPDIDLVKELKSKINLPINAEGRIWDIEGFEKVLEAGADMVTIGTAITRPHLVTERFTKFNTSWFSSKDS